MHRVLLVDDDIGLSALLKEYLEGEGFQVDVVQDGEPGVQRALDGDASIVVLDVMLPLVNGIEALRQIRQLSQIPVLMLTGRGDDLDRVVGLELGADDYVPKPCRRGNWSLACARFCGVSPGQRWPIFTSPS
jgi:two-component system, OmpR family, response regulator